MKNDVFPLHCFLALRFIWLMLLTLIYVVLVPRSQTGLICAGTNSVWKVGEVDHCSLSEEGNIDFNSSSIKESSAFFFFFPPLKVSSAFATSNTVFLRAENVFLKLQTLNPFINVDSESIFWFSEFQLHAFWGLQVKLKPRNKYGCGSVKYNAGQQLDIEKLLYVCYKGIEVLLKESI